MMFADRQDVGRPGDSHFHCGRWMLPGVVVDLIPYTCRAGKTPRPSQSGHGSRVGLLLPKLTRQVLQRQAHCDQPARTVRQRPLMPPSEGAVSPSVSHSVRRHRPATISLGSGGRRTTDQRIAGRRSSQVVRECLLGTGCYPYVGHATGTLPGPITSAWHHQHPGNQDR